MLLPLTSPGLPGNVLIPSPACCSFPNVSTPLECNLTVFSPAALIKSTWKKESIYLLAIEDAWLDSTLAGVHWAELNWKPQAGFDLSRADFFLPFSFFFSLAAYTYAIWQDSSKIFMCTKELTGRQRERKKHHQRIQRISRYSLLRPDILCHLSQGDRVSGKIIPPTQTGWHVVAFSFLCECGIRVCWLGCCVRPRYQVKDTESLRESGGKKEGIRTVGHTFILDLQVFVSSRARIRKDIRSGHNGTLGPVVTSENSRKRHNVSRISNISTEPRTFVRCLMRSKALNSGEDN